MKKLISILLAMTLVFGITSMNAFAFDISDQDSSNYIRMINGEEYDISRNAAPDSYQWNADSAANDAAAPTGSDTIGTRSVAPDTMPTGGGEYPYDPDWWNDPDNIYRANCYGYILNRVSTDYDDDYAGYLFQPGYKTGDTFEFTCTDIIDKVTSDLAELGRTIRSSTYSEVPGSNEYKIALVIDPGGFLRNPDYHWYRQNSDGTWSHKRGLTEVTNLDASGNIILDPRTCDRDYPGRPYSTWCGYYIISR